MRRADSLHAASRHLAIYRPNVVMVDLGLPDGDGLALIRHLASASTPLGAIVALSGHERATWQAEAIAAGAAACLEKPIPSLRASRSACSAVLPDAETRRGPDERELALAGRASVLAALAEDLRRARSLLAEALPAGDAETVAYCAQFLGSVGEMLGDRDLAAAARGAAAGRAARLADLLDRRLGARARASLEPAARASSGPAAPLRPVAASRLTRSAFVDRISIA